MSTLLRPGTTYLPHDFSDEALRRFGEGDFLPLIEEIRRGDGLYERLGVDRAVAIAVDLASLGVAPGAPLLDVGCSIGTISALLSATGYDVTGIDSDVVAAVQHWQSKDRIAQERSARQREGCRFYKRDLREHLSLSSERYEAVVLLSVLHHWLAGYGYTGETRFERDEIRHTLRQLCARVDRCIYLEVPISDEREESPPDPSGEFIFPAWFLREGLATRSQLIASTVASNGKPRRLYRVEMT
jgi:SAM-dependent methyltransferase